MQYQKVVRGIFLDRPNRFIAHVAVDGVTETVHVKNTGRCRELLVPGTTVWLEDFEGKMGSRKLRFSLIAVEKGSAATGSRSGTEVAPQMLLINMDSQAPNVVVRECFLASGAELIPSGVTVPAAPVIALPGAVLPVASSTAGDAAGAGAPGRFALPGGFRFRSEVTYGDSRFDFYFEKDGQPGFLEVKGCTLESGGHCRFPDAPTERGVKHLEELIAARQSGYWAGVLILVQMAGMKDFSPNDDTDPAFGAALRRAAAAGVEVLCYGCSVTPDSLELCEPVPVIL